METQVSTHKESYATAYGDVTAATFYCFTPMPDCADVQPIWKQLMLDNAVKGTIIVSPEGINATISGPLSGVNTVLDTIRSDARFKDMDVKYSSADFQPFGKAKVRLKKETIPLGAPVNPRAVVGSYVEPKDWDALITQDDVITIDTRNVYETKLGTFKGAVDPNTKTFKELPQFVKEKLDKNKHKKVAMFCTGGIRCEKFSSYLLEQGFENVYHLKGGILKYLEEVKQEESSWEGDCYVFDDRVAVGHGLVPAKDLTHCKKCGHVLTASDYKSELFVEKKHCKHCAPLYKKAWASFKKGFIY